MKTQRKNLLMEQKEYYLKNGDVFSYFRPSQMREIPLKQCSIRGYIPSLKQNTEGEIWSYESQLERDFLYLLDHDPNCIDLQTQPCQIPFITKEKRKAIATPDVWAIFQDGRQFLFEVKTEENLQELSKDINWQLKTEAIMRYCKSSGLKWTYQIVTERKIRCLRLNNIKDFLAAAKHYSTSKINKNIDGLNTVIRRLLQDSSVPFGDLVNQLSTLLPLEKSEIISILKHKLYFFYLAMNWDESFEEDIVSLNTRYSIRPVYELPNDNTIKPVLEQIETPKAILLSEKDQKVYDERMAILSPLIEIYGREATRTNVAEYCNQQNLPFTWYKWYLVWKKEGSNIIVKITILKINTLQI